MAYIGPPPSQKLATPTSQYFSGNGSATAFTLNRPVNVAEDLNVFVNNVPQEPGSGKSYTATGTTLTFDAAPASGTNNVYVVYRGLSEGTLRLESSGGNVVDDTSPELGGDLQSNGHDIVFADSDKAIFGAGSDLKIYHNGSNSFIDEAGTGDLYIRSNSGVNINKYTGETMIYAVPDGAVNLYYNNVKKLETNSIGATITGILASTQNIQVASQYALRFGSIGSNRITGNESGNTQQFYVNSTERFQINTNGPYTFGQYLGGFGGQTTSGTTNWNDVTNARSGSGYTLLLGTATNGPGGGYYFHSFCFEYAQKDGTGNMTQWAISYHSNNRYQRTRYGGTWTSWSAF